jgi:hypothetical protein
VEKRLMMKSKFGKLLTVFIFACAMFWLASPAGAQGRLMAPDSIRCDPNHLTSFTGRILSYQRRPGRVWIRMRTDEATTESFTLRFRRTEDAARWFLLMGETFKQSDWSLIERSRYRLRPNMRATVWVCDDRSTPIVDWRPNERRGNSVY